ncbi:MAG: hydrolase TatD, partial [Deltaproteobacteria bacterium]|nr:hydrolase TatD [Deltaproteobacteria bacterium]
DMARKCIDLGFYISIPGVVTFDKSGKIRDVVERVPLSSLLLETDAPYLTPVPNRGKRNEPAFIVHTAKAVDAIKKISWEDGAAQTSVNTINLFGLKMIRNV